MIITTKLNNNKFESSEQVTTKSFFTERQSSEQVTTKPFFTERQSNEQVTPFIFYSFGCDRLVILLKNESTEQVGSIKFKKFERGLI